MDICIWDKCNNRCQMCTNPDLPWVNGNGQADEGYGYDSLISRFKGLKKKLDPNEPVILTGGEPTLHPMFPEIFRFVRENFPGRELRLLTNGRRLYYRDFAVEVMSAGNLNLAISLCGPDAKVHDGVTGVKGSFIQAVGGIENVLKLKKKGQAVEIRTVLSKLTYRQIDRTLKFVASRFPTIDKVIVIYLEAEGQAKKNLDKVMVPYSQVRPQLEKVYPFFSVFRDLCLYHFPLCVLDAKFWPFVWRTLPSKEVGFIPACAKCRYKKYCLGIHRDYPDRIKSGEFKPISDEYEIEETGDFYHPINAIGRHRMSPSGAHPMTPLGIKKNGH